VSSGGILSPTFTGAFEWGEVGAGAQREAADSVEALYRRYAPMIARRCRGLLGDEQLSLDATHDVFLRVCASRSSFRGEAELSTWIYRVTTNHCLNQLRNRRRRGRLLAVFGAPPEPEPAMEGALARRQLLEALLSVLGPDDVQLLVHEYIDELSQSEIAELLGVTERTVRNRLRRALERVRGQANMLEQLEACR
jgi:RNA polymerase sigma-70 factor (ECF subfamily)